MNKIYLGTTEVANVGSGGGGGGDYVLNSSFDEMTRVAASALLDLKQLSNESKKTEEQLVADMGAYKSDISTLTASKADVSAVYLKEDIDDADKVAAAALASLDDRVSTLESGGGGGGITPAQLDASLRDYTYDKAFIDASIIALDASIVALDASALYFDASIKELAQGGGGGGDAAFVKYTNTSDSTKVGIVSSLRTAAPCTSIGNMAVICGNGTASGNGAFSSGLGVATGNNSVALGDGTATGFKSVAFAQGKVSGSYAVAIGPDASAADSYAIAIGEKCKALSTNAFAEGYDTTAQSIVSGAAYNKVCHAEGLSTKSTGGYGSHSEGYYSTAAGVGSHAEGYFTTATGQGSHSEGQNVKVYNYGEHGEGVYNKCSSTGGTEYNNFGSPLNTLSTIGNGNNANKHNAFEVRQSGDIYVADVSAAGNYYEKPMINLQQKIYELEARIAALEGA